MHKAERWLVMCWMGLVAGLYTAALVSDHLPTQLFYDNASWTLAFLLAVFLSWRGWVRAAPVDRFLVGGLLAGSVLIFLGQLVWNLQVALGWNPFPSPADGLFLLAGPVWALTIMRVSFQRMSRDRVYASSLDFGGAVLALLAITLVVYVPSGDLRSFLVGAVLVAYPVSFLTAASVAVLAVPSLGVRLRWC